MSGPGDTLPEEEGAPAADRSFRRTGEDSQKFRGDCFRLGGHLHLTDWEEMERIPQMPLSLKEAQTGVELARAHAEKIGVSMNIAVVDGGGHLLALPIIGDRVLILW